MEALMRLLFGILLLTAVTFAQSGPKDRQPTDPKSVSASSYPSAKPVPVEDLYYTRAVSGAAWSPDGKEVSLTTNLTGRLNLWKVSASGAWPVQLAQSDDRQVNGTWSPDSRSIIFQQDKGGNELWDLYTVPREGGEVINLTNTPEIREEDPRWSADAKQIAFTIKPKSSPHYDIAVMDWSTRQVKKLTNESDPQYSWSTVDWSPDGKTFYATRSNSDNTDSDIYSIDVATKAATNLTAHQGKVVNNGTAVSRDGRQVLLTSNAKGGYNNVALLDVATKKLTWVTNTQWEAESGVFSPDGSHFTYSVNEDGRRNVYVADRQSQQGQKLAMPEGINSIPHEQEFAPDGRQLLISHQAANTPADIWIYDLANNKPRQLTYGAVASLNPQNIPSSQLVHYKSFDGKIISAFLYLPFNVQRNASTPVIMYPHGGPTGQTQDSFSRGIAALTTRGYIVIAPNPRGSTGYGIEFQHANYQDLGGGDLEDDMAAIKFVLGTGYGDPKRVGVTGGSYGGFTTLMALGRHPETFAAAVDLFGPLDWYSMLKNTDPSLQEYIKSLLGDPEKFRKVYEDDAPMKYVQNIKAPLLVLQGENDVRVPKEETEQVVDLLKKKGNIVDAHYYPQEGHGFVKRENQIDSINRTLDWFERYLKNAGATTASRQ
jgi:dipeptidyl aminopeptidase/acylaminoacyl peptidase